MIEESQFLFKSLLLVWIVYHYGIILGLIITYILFMSYRVFMKKVFGLEMLLNLDKVFIGDNRVRVNLQCLQIFDDFDAEKIRELFIKRGIMNIKKLRQKIVYKFGNYYLKEIQDINEAYERIQIINDSNIKNDEDMHKYAQVELNNIIDTLKDLPYEIKIVRYAGGEGGAVLWKIDHVMSDGLGIVSTICALADNYDINVFPPMMRNYKYKWYIQVLDWLQFIYYGPQVVVKMFTKDPNPSPFRQNSIIGGESLIVFSKVHDLDKFAPLRKELKISFNDIVMCVISKAFNRVCQKFGDKYKNRRDVRAFMPVGRKEVPRNISEVRLCNEISALYMPIPLIDDIKTEHKKVTKVLHSYIYNSGYTFATVIFFSLAVEFLPKRIEAFIGNFFAKNIDMTVSNVPGPIVPLFYSGFKCTNMTPMTTTLRQRAFAPVCSYNKQFRFAMSIDKESKIDNKEFLKMVDDEIENLIK
jgi:hypothetical protein